MLVRRQIISQLPNEVRSKMNVQLLSRNIGIYNPLIRIMLVPKLTDIRRLSLSDYVVYRLWCHLSEV
jgi:hypothetical protein